MGGRELPKVLHAVHEEVDVNTQRFVGLDGHLSFLEVRGDAGHQLAIRMHLANLERSSSFE